MKTKIQTIDKQVALKYLSFNRKNRPLNMSRVKQYVREMTEGKWKSGTGEAIKFCTAGFLIDGQHRLAAIAEANVSLDFLVVSDLDASVFDVLDTGKVRGAADVFALSGIPNYTSACSILRDYMSFKNGKFYSAMARSLSATTNAALLEYYNTNPTYFDDVVNKASRIRIGMGGTLSKSTLGSFYLLFNEKNPLKAVTFFDELGGFKPTTNSTLEVLKRTLIKDRLAARKMSSKHRYALIVKAWNAYILDTEIKILRYVEENETFPKIL